MYALRHLDGTGSLDSVQHDLPLLCLIVHELLLQDLARLRDAGRAVRLVCRCGESRTRESRARAFFCNFFAFLSCLSAFASALVLAPTPTSASASKRIIIGRAMPSRGGAACA